MNCQLLIGGPGDLNELLFIHIPDAHGVNVDASVSQLFGGLSHLVLGLAVREDQKHLGGTCVDPAAHVWLEVVPHLSEGGTNVGVSEDLLDVFNLKGV